MLPFQSFPQAETEQADLPESYPPQKNAVRQKV
jgi:hypothetical protein